MLRSEATLEMTPYYVYIILCEGDKLYTGYTKSLKSRMRLHMKGKGGRYTRTHKPIGLVYYEKHSSRAEAMRREKRIKRLSHRQKLELTESTAKPKTQRTGNSCSEAPRGTRRRTPEAADSLCT